MKMKIWKTSVLAMGISIIAVSALADPYTPAQNQQPLTAQQFAAEANKGNQEEVNLGKLALEKSRNPDVINFAHHMIKDHSASNAKLIAIASSEGINLSTNDYYTVAGWPYTNNTGVANYKGAPPAGAEALTTSTISETNGISPDVARLQGLSGVEFDRAYASEMVSDHRNDVEKFQTASQTVSDPELKNYAKNTLPKLEEHLRMAQDLATKVGAQP